MNGVRFALAMRSGGGAQSGPSVSDDNASYGRFEGAVTRDVSFVKRGAFTQLVAQPFSSLLFPRPPPAGAPPRPADSSALNAARPDGAPPRPPPPPPRPPRPALKSARSRVMNVGSSDARYASIATIVAFPLRSSNTILSKLSRLVW